MTPRRPYLIRALYEWILDNDCTPYMLVNALMDGVSVPAEHVKDGQIILNVSPVAVQSLLVSNESVDFEGRFAGVPRQVSVPIAAVMGIYAKENGQGMLFDSTPPTPSPSPEPGTPNKPEASGRPSLKLVK